MNLTNKLSTTDNTYNSLNDGIIGKEISLDAKVKEIIGKNSLVGLIINLQ